jgi:RNA polymerase-binding transcription factor DksA
MLAAHAGVEDDGCMELDEEAIGAPAATGPLELDRLAHAERDLAGVERAMERLDAGTWGTCEACGARIDAATLARLPRATACAAHG